MAYGIWLYKTIETQHGDVTLYIKKRNYTGEAIEINALAPDSLTLSIDGDKLTDPIIGSTLTFGIIDTEQIDTTQFFTPDATLYKVELYRGGVLEWSGYLTPDSYQENLSYRDTISLVARDNLGRLEEFKIEEYQGLQNIEILIDSFLAEVGCPQVLNWQCDKVATEKGEGVEIDTPIRDMWVNTRLWIGKTYRDAVEDILKGLGCQMRFAGNNNLVIFSISDFAEFANQSAIFINKSGHKEIIPAWRDATITQDYGLIENFFDGNLTEEECGSLGYFNPADTAPDRWEGNYNFQNQYGWNNDLEDNQQESIYPTLMSIYSDDTFLSGSIRAIYKVPVTSTNVMAEVKMQLNNTLRRMRNIVFNSTSNLYVTGDRQKYTLQYNFQIALRKADGVEYVMTENSWVERGNLSYAEYKWIKFIMPDCELNNEGTWNKEQEVSIQIYSIPYDGELLLYIYPVMWGEDGAIGANTYSGKIRDISISYRNNIGQKSSRVQIDTKHNINGEVQINVGQVPSGKGDYLAYAGGLFAADGEPLSFFKRKTNDIFAYNLLELVGRENIHLQKRNFAALSGEMTAKDTTITLGANIAYKGKYYALISASLNILRNTLSVTRMQEVEDYQIAELTIIDSPLESSQGNKVGSGNNEVIQFSDDAGNAKRLYELQDATDQDQEGAFIIIDKSSMAAAKKLPISAVGKNYDSEILDLNNRADANQQNIEGLQQFMQIASQGISTNKTNIATNTTNITNLKNRANGLQGNIEDLQDGVATILNDYLSKANGGEVKADVLISAALKMNTLYLPNSNNTPSGYVLSVGSLGSGADVPEGGGSGIAQVTINVNGSPYKTDANGVVTLPNYPTSLPASDVYDWAKAATKPTYTKSEVGLGNVDNTSDSNKIVKAVIDYNDTARTVYIGYAGTGLTVADTSHLAAYSRLSDGRQVIKDISKDNVKAWLGLSDLAYLSSISWNKITSDKPTTLSGYGITDKVAYRETWNNLMHSSNEFTFAAPAYSGYLWMNYRTASGGLDGAITEYRFAKGAGQSYADIRAAKYIVNGGTSSQFLKADGSLDDTSYLPLSGGTISGSGAELLKIDSSNGSYNVILFKSNGATKSEFGYAVNSCSYMFDYTSSKYLGIDVNGTPFFGAISGSGKHTLIHSGNIGSQSVDAATRLARVGGVSDANTITFTDYSLRWYSAIANTATNLPSFSGYQNGLLVLPLHSSGTTAQIYMTAGSNLYFRGNTNADWNTIIHSGNIGSQSVNAVYNSSTYIGAASDAYPELYGAIIFTYGNNPIHFYTNYQERMTITGGGNVLIGTTDDNGVSGKLLVNGGVTLNGYMSNNSVSKITDLNGKGLVVGTSTTRDNWGMAIWTYGNGMGLIQQQAFTSAATTYPISLQPFGGNVLIGTIADNGAKLQVAGSVASYNSNADAGFRATGSSYSLFFGIGNGNVNRGIYDDTNARWWIYRDATTNTCIPDGNVGIGTTNPQYKLDVNGSSSFTSGYKHLTRTGDSNYTSGWFYGTYGNEAMAFINNAAASSFMFVQGKTAIENWNTDTWQSVEPALQIKQNCVAINYLWGHNVTPDYTLRVMGTAYFSDNISASGYQLPTSAPSNPVSGGYYLYVGTLGAGATIS